MKKIISSVIAITMAFALMLMPVNGLNTVSAGEETYSLVYAPGEGTGTMNPATVTKSQTYTFPQCTFKAPNGKAFNHWKMSGVDGIFTPGQTVQIAENCLQEGIIIVTAYWKEAPHTHDGVTFDATDSLPNASGNYYLTKDIELEQTWNVTGNKTINLCLNGHSIKMRDGVKKRIIYIDSSSTLNIHDCDTVTKHKYKIVDRFAKLSEDGNKSFTGGYITGGIDNKGGPDDNEGGGAIFSQGVCSLNGGTLIANRAADKGIHGSELKGGAILLNGSNAKCILKKGNIIGNYAPTTGGAVAARWGATLEMYDGVNIIENHVDFDWGDGAGAGVVLEYSSSFNMYGGRISDNEGRRGGGVFVNGESIFNMSGGAIENNQAICPEGDKSRGGGLAVDGTFNMSGGVIQNNTAQTAGGLMVFNRRTFNMTGGKIINNKSTGTRMDGGIEVGTDTHFELSGDSVICGNTNNGKPANIYLEGNPDTHESTKILITGKLKNSLPEGIIMQAVTGVFTEGLSTNGDFSRFKSDTDGYVPMFTDKGEAQIVEGAWNFTGITWTGYSKAVANYEYSKDKTVKYSMDMKITTKQVGRTINYTAKIDKDWSLDNKEHSDIKKVSLPKYKNALFIKGKTVKVKYKKLKKKKQNIKAKKCIKFKKKGQGKLRYKLVKVKKAKFKKYFKINKKTGKLTIKKKLKKGKYKLTVKVKAVGNADFKPSAWKKITVKVKVK